MLATIVLPLLAFQATASVLPRQAITPLTAAQIAAFKPYTYFASAAFCSPGQTLTWSCGPNCDANPGFKSVATGGDGDLVPYWFVGYDPTTKEVIVSHEGADTSKIIAALTDNDLFLESLNPTLFPGVSSAVEVCNGFATAQAASATNILAAVKETMSLHAASEVTMVGFSMGAAIALIDSVYLPLHLPATTKFRTITYGMPRVGNQAFADYIDAHASLTHINNKEDPVPILPGTFLGFVSPSGEIHIENNGDWEKCPGQDNPSTLCAVGAVPNIFEGNVHDHAGPYDGVEMGC